MMKRIYLLFLICSSAILMSARCTSTGGGCGGASHVFFSYKGARLDNMELIQRPQEAPFYTYSSLKRFEPLTYAVTLSFNTEERFDANYAQVDMDETTISGFSIIPVARAECYIPRITTLDKIESISVKTVRNFDQEHPAGSDVTEYFKVSMMARTEYEELTNRDILLSHYYAEEKSGFWPSMIIALRRNPEIDRSKHQFEFNVKFEGGKTLSVKTDEIVLYNSSIEERR